MTNRNRFKRDPQTVIDAIRGSRGIKSVAARKLKIARNTLDNYINKIPEVRAAYDDEVETLLDAAENVLFDKAINEESEHSLHFLLERKGKSRGYAKRQEITAADQYPVDVTLKIGNSDD